MNTDTTDTTDTTTTSPDTSPDTDTTTPDTPTTKLEFRVGLSAPAYAALKTIGAAAGKLDRTRPGLHAVRVVFEPGDNGRVAVSLAATNSYILAEHRLEVEGVISRPVAFTISVADLTALTRGTAKTGELEFTPKSESELDADYVNASPAGTVTLNTGTGSGLCYSATTPFPNRRTLVGLLDNPRANMLEGPADIEEVGLNPDFVSRLWKSAGSPDGGLVFRFNGVSKHQGLPMIVSVSAPGVPGWRGAIMPIKLPRNV